MIKRTLSVLPLLAVLLLTSCSGAVTFTPPEIMVDFECGFEADYSDMHMKGHIISMRQNVTTITLTEPENLNDLVYKWVDDVLSISYNGLQCDTQNQYLPSNNFAQAMYNVLKSAKESAVYESTEENTCIFTGESQSGAYILKTDKKTGEIQSLQIEALKLNVAFTVNQDK